MKRLAIIAIMMVLTAPATAQQARRPPQAAPPAKEEPAAEPPPAAYEPDLLRLAEIMGTLAYMTVLCGQPGSDSWPQRITQLMEAEGTTPQRRERLAGAYNRGYIGHQPSHRQCTDRSKTVIDRLLLQGQRLTRDISSRYAG